MGLTTANFFFITQKIAKQELIQTKKFEKKNIFRAIFKLSLRIFCIFTENYFLKNKNPELNFIMFI